MTEECGLEESLKEQLQRTGLTVDALADRTKIPRATIQSLLGEEVSAILPERVYLRGQTATLAKELGMNVDSVLAAFDARYPKAREELDEPSTPAGRGRGTAFLGAGLGCIAILAVVAAFASAF
ncbi:MAG TPA: helix-turn-helix domain-containing protein [Myxococcales bacterium LLY-WYZ-16_1]|mgnify:CR=1 FL=1|jgi:cytoskeletal protein RodZ|nr:helix-turn-helix domain-containing protein [Myxococcales bacterium LLY-WYZ-16_1]